MSDLIRGNTSHPYQYTAITSMDGANADMLMDYGILRLNQGHVFKDNAALEKAHLLVRPGERAGGRRTLPGAQKLLTWRLSSSTPTGHPVTITGLCQIAGMPDAHGQRQRLWLPHLPA